MDLDGITPSGLPFPSAGHLVDPGIDPEAPATSPALAGGFFTTEPPGTPPDIDYNKTRKNNKRI